MWMRAIEVSVVLAVARVVSKTVRFQTVARHMGWQPGIAPESASAPDAAVVDAIANEVAAATARFGFHDPCLAQSLAAKWLLTRRGVPSTIHFGFRIRGSAALAAAFDPEVHVATHAWVQVGDRLVTGKDPSANRVIGRYH